MKSIFFFGNSSNKRLKAFDNPAQGNALCENNSIICALKGQHQ